MKAIRIIAKQNMVNYKRPMSYVVGSTYPLPPYSTVIGMVHTACGFTSYHPMQVSVQGDPKSVITDLQLKYSGGTIGYEKGRHSLKVPTKDMIVGYAKGPFQVELITEIDLVLHIVPEDENEIEEIVKGLKNPKRFLALGRHEDILNILEVKVVDLKETDEVTTKFNMYIKPNGNDGTIYKLRKVFRIDNKLRKFDEVHKMLYIGKGQNLYDVTTDEDGYLVCLV